MSGSDVYRSSGGVGGPSAAARPRDGGVLPKPLVVTLCAILLALAVPPITAQAARGCRPDAEFTYTATATTAVYEVDLPECWRGKGRYELGASIDRVVGPNVVVGIPGGHEEDNIHCRSSRVCRIEISLPHPEVEVAYYNFQVDYQVSPKSGGHQSFFLRCVSSPVHRMCDPNLPVPTPSP